MAFKRIHIFLFVLLVLILPIIALAACTGRDCSLQNPLSVESLKAFVELALRVFIMIMLPVIAFFIVLAGLNFVLARGKPEQLKAAKLNFLFVIVGTCLILGAWLLANLIGATVSQVIS